jgi:hypothetical protein
MAERITPDDQDVSFRFGVRVMIRLISARATVAARAASGSNPR